MSNTHSLPAACEPLLAKWQTHPFYTSAVVLGLDVGLEGIGVCVRRGREILYARSWLYDVPQAARLAGRRQLRGARHCRANRKTRLARLRALFEKHGLPWLAEDSPALRHSDPFILRHRAVSSANGLASREALSIAIRHCVAHRGHDYEYFSDEGAYPWGDSTEFKKVMKELETLWLTREEADRACADAEFFEWKDEEVEQFRERVRARVAGPELIGQHLAAHAKGSKNHVRKRAKGEAFPRKLVRAHLDQIIARHEHLIDDVDGFRTALFRENKTAADREHSIFYYHRKTKVEMKAHFEKKRRRCPYAPWLGLGNPPTDPRGKIEIRRWSLLEFAAMRDVEVQEKKTKRGMTPRRWRVPLGASIVKRLVRFLRFQAKHPEWQTARAFAHVKKKLIAAIEAAHDAKVAPEGGKSGSELNKHFFTILRDLLAPSMANRAKNAPMSAAAAAKLFAIATARGFEREGIRACLENCRPGSEIPSLYNFRRQPAADLYGVYPQVEFLLGQRVKKAKTHPKNGAPKKRGDLAVKGKLQRLFDEIIGADAAPDYCVVEVARDLPRNQKQAREREELIAANRERREKLIEKYQEWLPKGGTVSGSMRRRIELHDQQGGICPFTGEPLGPNPLGDDLDVEHLFPESRGGLTVDENLVLTFARVNRGEKKNRTPREYAAAIGRPFEEMEAFTKAMRWGTFKREVFAWADGEKIPEFGNTTRVAQLARQLLAEVARWMHCTDADKQAERVGNPTGFQTAACRRAWNLVEKDRSDLTHHLVDAIILAHIPPREGQNYVQSGGGIFLPQYDAKKERTTLDVLPLGPDPAKVEALSKNDALECPVIAHRSQSNHRRLHDKTHWRVRPDGSLAARDDGKFPAKGDFADADALRARLLAMGIPANYKDREGKEKPLIPSRAALDKWLDAEDAEPLRLTNGTPVKVAWKDAGKGGMQDSPLGYQARWNSKGRLAEVKVMSPYGGRWEALELWRGWNEKAKRWEYYKRLIPTRAVFRAMQSLGISWKKKSKIVWREGAPEPTKSWKRARGGELPRYARRAVHPITKQPIVFHTGDVFRIGFTRDGKPAMRGETPTSFGWVSIKAVMQGTMSRNGPGRLELVSAVTKGLEPGAPSNPDDLAFLAGLPPADDPSSYPTQRPPGPSRPGREADLRLE
jgi:hypothetical protein